MLNKRSDNKKFSLPPFFPKNRRGQDISISTIILIVLGLAVLVLLIIGFTQGWSSIAPWLSGDNVDNLVSQCQASCATGGTYAFCNSPKDLKTDNLKLSGVTCYYLAKQKPEYGIAECPSVTCDVIFTECGEKDNGKVSQLLKENTLEICTCGVSGCAH
jgi:hypothetical protein